MPVPLLQPMVPRGCTVSPELLNSKHIACAFAAANGNKMYKTGMPMKDSVVQLSLSLTPLYPQLNPIQGPERYWSIQGLP